MLRTRSPEAYVRRAIVNAVTDEPRRPWRREVPWAEPPDLPDARVDDDRLALVEALAVLPPGQRAVLVLRFLEGLDIRETAQVLECSTGTVKSQTTYGLRKLRRLLTSLEEGRPR